MFFRYHIIEDLSLSAFIPPIDLKKDILIVHFSFESQGEKGGPRIKEISSHNLVTNLDNMNSKNMILEIEFSIDLMLLLILFHLYSDIPLFF